jgi:uncharacterized protein
MFAPRRVGKTYFLDHDLAQAARQAKLLPVYADLWLQKSAPLEAFYHALEERPGRCPGAPKRGWKTCQDRG